MVSILLLPGEGTCVFIRGIGVAVLVMESSIDLDGGCSTLRSKCRREGDGVSPLWLRGDNRGLESSYLASGEAQGLCDKIWQYRV